jgi:hypothetical protein
MYLRNIVLYPHGIATQTTLLCQVTALRTSNPAFFILLLLKRNGFLEAGSASVIRKSMESALFGYQIDTIKLYI